MEPPPPQTAPVAGAPLPSASAADPAISTAATPQLRLPPFWRQNPRSWFRQVEAQFALRHIQSQQSKYFHVLAGLPPEVAAELDDVLASVSLTEAYDVLKSAILDRLEISERARIQQLLSEEDLGDRKPSQLLHRMKQLLGDSASQSQQPLLRELFLQRLPQAMRMVLAGSDDLALDKLAALADRIADYSAPGHPPVVAAATPSQPSRLDRIEHKLQELTDAFHSLSVSRPRRRRRSNSRPPQARRQSPTPPTPMSEEARPRTTLCWYHHRFRHRAQRCISPCSWQGN